MSYPEQTDLLKLIAYMGMHIKEERKNDVRPRMEEVFGYTDAIPKATEKDATEPERIFLVEAIPCDNQLCRGTKPLRDAQNNHRQEYVPEVGYTIWDTEGRSVTWFCVYDNGTVDYFAIDYNKQVRRRTSTHKEMSHWQVATQKGNRSQIFGHL